MGYDSFTPEERAAIEGPAHYPDYMRPREVPVINHATVPDIVLFDCTCGDELCSWQVEISRKSHFVHES